MKAAGVIVLMILVAAGAFIAGRTTLVRTAPETATLNPSISVSVSPVSKPTGPTQYERDLMSSLNAVQSAVNTGVNRSRYSELISSARTKLADLKMFSPNSPLAGPAETYLSAHAKTLSIWAEHYDAGMERVYVGEQSAPELFKFVREAIPNVRLVEMNLPNKMYEFGSIGELWAHTEGRLWAQVMAGWQKLGS